ncbi:MAG: efflux RND transporter permease subunit, partial [Terrimicrobiaceae bacterium]
VLMVWLIRGKITPEIKHPINSFLICAYQPFVDFVLRFRWLTLGAALIILAATYYPFSQLGKEFMPPLNEGSLLYMPTAVPGMSITEATKILQIQDRILRKFPEVESVFGKAGQAETPTDPAPLSMFETVVMLKPFKEWRAGMTWEKLLAEMNEATKTPGMAQIFWMPIQTRTEMLTTGFRTILGIKVFGPDLKEIEKIAVQIENALSDFPDTRSVFAERTTGGYFLDFTVDREAAARYGLRVQDVNDIIESAIGGKTIAMTVEGRERYPINVRYARDFRDDLDSLKRVLVPTPTGAQVPISMLAEISNKTGPPSIRNENAQLVGFVFVDITTANIGGYVKAASERIGERMQFPTGYYIQWAGQFEYLKAAEKRLAILVPFTLLIIFVLIYMNTQSITKTLIVLLAVPFSLVGAFWTLYLLGYNMSVAVWVGLIALAGLDAETGVVMLLYLDHAWEKYCAEGRMSSMSHLYAAAKEGAVQRIRPKIMTVCAILFGLLPIMWSPTWQAGADVMKRIAAPMIGGVITSAILELLIYPVIFVIWRRRSLPKDTRDEHLDAITDEHAPSAIHPRRSFARFFVTAVAIAALGIGGYYGWQKFGGKLTDGVQAAGTPFATQTVGGLTITLLHPHGQLRTGANEAFIEFRNAGGELIDAGEVKLNLGMNMTGMVMQSAATVKRPNTPGRYRVEITPGMGGDWLAHLTFDGPQGHSETSFILNVKP